MTSPDHLGPSHSASEVTIATVSADAAARVASRTPEISIRLKRARSGRPRTNQPAPPDTAAAKRTTRPRPGRRSPLPGPPRRRWRSGVGSAPSWSRRDNRGTPGRSRTSPGMFPEGGLRREGQPRLDREEDQRHHRQLADRRHGTAEAWSQPLGRGGSGQHTAGDTSTLVASRTTPDEPAPSAGSVDWAARQGCASAWAPAIRSAGTRPPQRRQSRVSARTSASSSASSALVSRPSRTTRAPWTHTSVIAWGDSA